MGPGWLQILIVVLVILLLFGRGKIAGLMGDVAKGIRSFRKGLDDDPTDPVAAAESINPPENPQENHMESPMESPTENPPKNTRKNTAKKSKITKTARSPSPKKRSKQT